MRERLRQSKSNRNMIPHSRVEQVAFARADLGPFQRRPAQSDDDQLIFYVRSQRLQTIDPLHSNSRSSKIFDAHFGAHDHRHVIVRDAHCLKTAANGLPNPFFLADGMMWDP